ncbi:MAG: integrase family protein [Alphaproteobacteria bacterium]|nr:integrase family protein [Alphaproteobacteria bacterium]
MLTEKRIRDAKPGPKAAILWDSSIKGLGVKIQPGGSKVYVLSYRIDGRKRQATLARVGELSLADARKRAGAEMVRIREGDADPLQRRQERKDAPTVADAFNRFLGPFSERRIANGRLTETTRSEYAKQARKYVLPALGSRKVASVTRGDVEALVEPMPGPTRNRVLAVVSRLMNVCETWEWRPQHSNPARGVERAKENVRRRVLSPAEMTALADALDGLSGAHPVAAAALKIAALSGLRISEVLEFRWENVDAETGRVHLPRTKTGERDHDLPQAAMAILATLPHVHGNPWCFASKAGAHVQRRQAGVVFRKAAAAAGIEDARVHDLRRTLATRAAAAGLSAFALRDMLGWKDLAMPARYVQLAGETAREHRLSIGDAIAADMGADHA